MERTVDVDVRLEPAEWAPSRRRRGVGPGVDPRLLRLGAAAAAIVLMVPVALAVRDDGNAEVRSAGPDAGPSGPAVLESTVDTTTMVTAAATEPASDDPPSTPAPTSGAAGGKPARRELSVATDEPAEPVCAGVYSVVAGDYWLRFVETSGADLDAWLKANDASVDTPLYAGDELCIPAGASAPAPPPSTAPPETTAAPTAPPSTAGPTDPPTTPAPPPATEPPTTQPPTTEPPAPATTVPAPVAPGDAEAIIRHVWPDEIEERALVIARRESGLRPDAYNGWCCYGLFQIYFEANRGFLAGLGVTAAGQLFDAGTNARVAYAMYQRSGWGPWASTDPG